MAIDFETGRPRDVALALGADRRREYRLLFAVLVATTLPVLVLIVVRPLLGCCLLLFAAYFQLLAAFATSTSTRTSHYLRFLLAGSNPVGMTGASSLIFGAVDAVIDWREDRAARRAQPVRQFVLLLYKFAMTPVGLVLMASEFLWDTCLLLRPGIVPLKWQELFSLAWYHGFPCPEKSNDLFYADMAHARFRDDPYLYQWNRLRALVFELEHYRLDAVAGQGVADTNLFLQDELSAYQSLQRLRVEELEQAVGEHFAHRTLLSIPTRLTARLVESAQPLRHYLRMRAELPERPDQAAWERALAQLCGVSPASYSLWHVLRVLAALPAEVPRVPSRYVTSAQLDAMVQSGVLAGTAAGQYRFEAAFLERLEALLGEQFDALSEEEVGLLAVTLQPTYLDAFGGYYRPRA